MTEGSTVLIFSKSTNNNIVSHRTSGAELLGQNSPRLDYWIPMLNSVFWEYARVRVLSEQYSAVYCIMMAFSIL